MRKYRIVTTIDPYNYNHKGDKQFTVQRRITKLLFFHAWVDIKHYITLEEAKEAIVHLNKPDIYL